ncbi:hypothetical protein SCP_1303670 [Sparassis crispa]|uniref:Uncharacterized protein n=1 Tax=Sparassis crispa TaxID=139825 RepID=A0A401H292_9APHY|nr:hypothetical protein SCP_1303670 [Sparassis crispa]GBE88551.1 hypothetical protein SCP_1303670 [Sparassis crispa]
MFSLQDGRASLRQPYQLLLPPTLTPPPPQPVPRTPAGRTAWSKFSAVMTTLAS